MPKKNRKSVEPVSLPLAPAHFHPRDWKDYVHEIDERRVDEKTSRYLIQAEASGIRPSEFLDPGYDDDVREHYIKDAAVRIANYESEKACWYDFRTGKLILVGYRDTGDGRLWRIPKYVWTDPSGSEDWRKGRLSGCGLCFFNVEVLEAAEAEKVPEFSNRRRSQGVDKGPALDECKTRLRKERRRWEKAGSPKKGWKPQHRYKKQALAHWQKRGLTNRDFDDLWAEVFPELKGNKGKSGWRSENDNHQWISDT